MEIKDGCSLKLKHYHNSASLVANWAILISHARLQLDRRTQDLIMICGNPQMGLMPLRCLLRLLLRL